MKYFKLPDLGEGLQEAEISQWHVKVGDAVDEDQLLLSVETAKAIVDIPSPQAGTIASLFGEEGDIIHIGEPLLEYAGEEQEDSGTVVGDMSVAAQREQSPQVDQFIIGSAGGVGRERRQQRSFATPAIRALARRMNIDLNKVSGSGQHGMITSTDLEKAQKMLAEFGEAQPLRGVRRAMANNLRRAHQEVVQVTINDLVDIHGWYHRDDPTLRLVRAIGRACQAEPNLNAWYDGQAMAMRVLDKVDLGIAVDTEDGLFVPVLRNISQRDADDVRAGLDRLRADVKARTIPPQELSGATITLSNFGTIAGRFGNPVVVPPTVAIIGAGTIYDAVIAVAGKAQIRAVLPLSLSFDHRPITGGEAARFLRAMMDDLQLAD